MNCKFVRKSQGVFACLRCSRVVRTLRDDLQIYAQCPAHAACHAGTELKALLAAWPLRLLADGDCKCRSRALLMDANGCDWCEANIEEIVGWLRESSAERGLPFVDMAGRVLIRRAIANARRKEQARAQEASQAEGPATAG